MVRTSLEIVAEILELCCSPRGITEIVYQCNLNFVNARTHIDKLIGKGLLEKIQRGKRIFYETTQKGKGMLMNELAIASDVAYTLRL